MFFSWITYIFARKVLQNIDLLFDICNILNVCQVNCTVIKSSMVYLPILSVVGFDNHHHLLPLFNLLKNTECTYLAAAYPFNCYYCTKKRCLFLGKASISYFFYLHVQLFDNTAFLWNVTKNLALKSRNNQFFSVTLFG